MNEIKYRGIKNFSTGIVVIISSVVSVGIIILLLFSLWGGTDRPVPYLIQAVVDNTFMPNCPEPTLTVLKNITTEKIVYKCGTLGTASELITLYE